MPVVLTLSTAPDVSPRNGTGHHGNVTFTVTYEPPSMVSAQLHSKNNQNAIN